ncbi:hypothetical protein MJO28_006535 [Puccinia striiformis f. sp. tritici]|uniref:Uncharacterized protein n=1 Tax=Puccinia striiformis f. sp. tritici TaxID=168172 RepID=A0ACC0EHB7_9BASI|nr:hypothetical protein MJO28_006535 [Puccinia striiformis f. sp. tritici]
MSQLTSHCTDLDLEDDEGNKTQTSVTAPKEDLPATTAPKLLIKLRKSVPKATKKVGAERLKAKKEEVKVNACRSTRRTNKVGK